MFLQWLTFLCVLWAGGSGSVWARAVWVLVWEKLELASWLVVIPWLITNSDVSAVIYWSAISVVNGLAAPKPPSQVSAGITISGRNSISGTVFTSRPSRARDLVTMGGGRSYTRTDQNGRRISFPGRWDGTQLARQIGTTYVTVGIRAHIYYRQFRQTIPCLLRKIWAACRS